MLSDLFSPPPPPPSLPPRQVHNCQEQTSHVRGSGKTMDTVRVKETEWGTATCRKTWGRPAVFYTGVCRQEPINMHSILDYRYWKSNFDCMKASNFRLEKSRGCGGGGGGPDETMQKSTAYFRLDENVYTKLHFFLIRTNLIRTLRLKSPKKIRTS